MMGAGPWSGAIRWAGTRGRRQRNNDATAIFVMNVSHLNGSLMKLFSFDKKKDLERYCRDLTVFRDDFANLVFTCEASKEPFHHEISYRDKVPSHLEPSASELEALTNSPAGTILSGDAAKAVRKMSQSFVERRYS
jgi:hypothetical protein